MTWLTSAHSDGKSGWQVWQEKKNSTDVPENVRKWAPTLHKRRNLIEHARMGYEEIPALSLYQPWTEQEATQYADIHNIFMFMEWCLTLKDDESCALAFDVPDGTDEDYNPIHAKITVKKNNGSYAVTASDVVVTGNSDQQFTVRVGQWATMIQTVLNEGQKLKTGQDGGGRRADKVKVLGRWRKVKKEGRKSMVTYKGELISLTEARRIERSRKLK